MGANDDVAWLFYTFQLAGTRFRPPIAGKLASESRRVFSAKLFI